MVELSKIFLVWLRNDGMASSVERRPVTSLNTFAFETSLSKTSTIKTKYLECKLLYLRVGKMSWLK